MESSVTLDRLLLSEEGYIRQHRKTLTAKKLQGVRVDLLAHLRSVGRSADLTLIIATERAIVEGDLARYANSKQMTASLEAALAEIAAIERHLAIVDDQPRYQALNCDHSLPRNRKGGLPLDEARQALSSHYARLNNMDKSRLDEEEKFIVDARKAAIFEAAKLYAARQAKTLGLNNATHKSAQDA